MQGDVAPNDASSPLSSPPNHPDGASRFTLSTPNPYVRLAIVAGILLPIATVPYLLSRRRISALQGRYEELEWKLNVLERRLSFNVSETTQVRKAQEKMQANIQDLMLDSDEMHGDLMQRSAEQSETNKAMQSDLQKLLEETRQTRTNFATLRNVGVSLADVAAFMQEMELQMGLQGGADKDSRGIHRLRLLALQMQKLTEKGKEAEKGQNT